MTLSAQLLWNYTYDLFETSYVDGTRFIWNLIFRKEIICTCANTGGDICFCIQKQFLVIFFKISPCLSMVFLTMSGVFTRVRCLPRTRVNEHPLVHCKNVDWHKIKVYASVIYARKKWYKIQVCMPVLHIYLSVYQHMAV